MYQAILFSMHTSFTVVSTSHFDTVVFLVSCELFSFSLLGRLAIYVVSWKYFFVLGSHNLESLSALLEGGVLYYYLVLELLDVLQLFSLLLFFHKFLFFGFFLLQSLLLSLLSELHVLYNKSLLLLPSGLEAIAFSYVIAVFYSAAFQAYQCYVERYQRKQEKTQLYRRKIKAFFSVYILLTQVLLQDFLDKLNKTLKAQF